MAQARKTAEPVLGVEVFAAEAMVLLLVDWVWGFETVWFVACRVGCMRV